MKAAIILFCFIPLCYSEVRTVDQQINELQTKVDNYAAWMIEPVFDLQEEKDFGNIYRLPVFAEPSLQEDFKEKPFKHDTYLATNYEIIDTPKEIAEDRQNAHADVVFHGFDEFYPFLVPKYLVCRYPKDIETSLQEQDDPFRPIFQSKETQPTFDKRFACLMYVIIEEIKEIEGYVVEIPFANRNETVPVLLHENNELYFQTPYLLHETGRPHTSFFYVRDQYRVYTWLPFIQSDTNVTYVVQVFVKFPVIYFKMLHKLLKERLDEAITNRDKLLDMPSPMKYLRLDDYYKLPMYENEELVPLIIPEYLNMPYANDQKDVPIVEQEIVKYMSATTITQNIYFEGQKGTYEQDCVDLTIRTVDNQILQPLIGVLNDLSAFFTLPITVGNISNYVAYIHSDKHGRAYTWLPFRFSEMGNTFLAQVRVQRSERFALMITTEQLIAQHGYYTALDFIPDLFKKKQYNRTIHDIVDDLRVFDDNYILAVSYAPSICAHNVLRRLWGIRTRCHKSEWLIHGLWYPKDNYMNNRKQECRLNDYREPEDIIENEDQVPEGYRNVSKSTSAGIDDVEFWDHEWCNNGFFMMKPGTNHNRFDSPADYFNLALNIFKYLDVEKHAKDSLKADDREFLPAKQFEKFLNKFPKRPTVEAYRISGNEIIAPFELRFCFNSFPESMIVPAECDPLKVQSTPDIRNYKRFYYPTSYSLFHFIFLRLRVTNEPVLRILDLSPSRTHAYMHAKYLQQRLHHSDAFQEQVYKESIRYAQFKEHFNRAWYNEHDEDIFDHLKWIFENVGILMYDVTEVFTRPLDYFYFATSLYDASNVSQWLAQVPLNRKHTKAFFIKKVEETFNVPGISLSCVKDEETEDDYLSEVRVCYSRSTFIAIPCPTNMKFLKGDYAGPKQIGCQHPFRIVK